MSFVGIDLGNDSCVVAVARQLNADIDVDVVLNDVSKRETPAVVSFDEGKQRLFGAAAAASFTRNLTNTVSQIKRLLGRSFSDPEFQKDLKSLPFKVTKGPDGYPLIHVSYLDKEEAFTPTQFLGMLLAHLKGIAEKNIKELYDDQNPVRGWCIGLPAYFTDLHRRAVMDAAKIAGLNFVRLLDETTAAALDYSTVQTDLPENRQVNVAFVDVGHASTQVCVAGLKKGQLSILGRAFDQSLGGRDFDHVLFEYFAAKFKEQYKINVDKSPRACLKLRLACQKTKIVLTSNPEAFLSVDSIIDDKDVKGFIKREEFEQLSTELLQRLKVPLKAAIKDADLSVDKIQSFVLVGAGSRVPAIVNILKDFFGGKQPRRTIVASECIARGCALQCASLGSTPNVPRIQVKETDAPVENGRGGMVGANLQKAIDRETDMACQDKLVEETEEMKNAVETDVYNTRAKIEGKYQEFLTDSEKEQLIEKLQEIEDWLYEDGMDETKDVYSSKLDEIKKLGDPAEERYKESTERRIAIDLLVQCIKSYMEEASSKDPKFNHIDAAEKDKAINECKEAEAWLVHQKQQQDTLPKYSTPVFRPTDLKRKADALDEICWPIMNKPRSSHGEKKNALEEYVYNMICKLNGEYREFVTDSEKKEFIAKLKQVKLWLYEDGMDETVAVYNAKHDEIKKQGDPIEERYKENTKRGPAIDKLVNCIMSYKDPASNDLAFDHIDVNEKQKVIKECEEAEVWLAEKIQQQDALPKHATPVLASADLDEKTETLDRFCRSIVNKPVPKLSIWRQLFLWFSKCIIRGSS